MFSGWFAGNLKHANQYIKYVTQFLLLRNSGVFPRRKASNIVQPPEDITLEN